MLNVKLTPTRLATTYQPTNTLRTKSRLTLPPRSLIASTNRRVPYPRRCRPKRAAGTEVFDRLGGVGLPNLIGLGIEVSYQGRWAWFEPLIGATTAYREPRHRHRMILPLLLNGTINPLQVATSSSYD